VFQAADLPFGSAWIFRVHLEICLASYGMVLEAVVLFIGLRSTASKSKRRRQWTWFDWAGPCPRA
jgi:hypothetical protein